MSDTYSITSGELVLKNDPSAQGLFRRYMFRRVLRIFIRCIEFCIALTITWLIFSGCLTTPTLSETISLGAVFATFGSSIVSIFSLSCKEQYDQFNENMKILQEHLAGNSLWTRWPFIKRVCKRKGADGKSEYQLLSNPYIVFLGFPKETHVSLPSSKEDFYELPIVKIFLYLKIKRTKYRNFLSMSTTSNSIKDILIWDCITDIYKDIILYRVGQFLIWFGGCFVISSIILTFLW
jgi:hypothetical protein